MFANGECLELFVTGLSMGDHIVQVYIYYNLRQAACFWLIFVDWFIFDGHVLFDYLSHYTFLLQADESAEVLPPPNKTKLFLKSTNPLS